ncbi:glycoside hydrolase family 3 protein [Anaerobium acetethylicum]|uniref:Beta-glucosidase n=1 Tax=Anaerobium acetethylicum TaxID=1619234 RepID=A0A1D3TX06_9FIRM|nr:glycoside hydrolase family 3 protein [Anaerobium acetethylicum]SCP98838.1 beta-glucosidase [Anaerobium acetethylicum]
MGYEDILATLKLGKEDKPILFCNPAEPVIYDINDIDGQYYMLDRDMGGCIAFPFTKHIRSGTGKVTLDGKKVDFVLKTMAIGMDAQWLGIRLCGVMKDYGKKGMLEISGFVDIDGNEMDPLTLTVMTEEQEEPNKRYFQHEEIALQAAEEGIVLLKNEEQTLPLKKGEVLNFFGRGLSEFRVCAVGAGKINPRYTCGLREAIQRSDDFNLNQDVDQYYSDGVDRLPSDEVLEKARKKSKKAFMLISRASGENYDNSSERGEFSLTEDEENLLKCLRENFNSLIVILNVGYPIETEFIGKYNVDAVVYNGFGGMLAGQALVNVLSGKVNPSGKLPDTWSLRYEDIPASKNFYDCVDGKQRIGANDGDIWVNTVYEEDIYVGYRYFESFEKPVGFPFGYGLSYTEFKLEVTNIKYEENQISIEVNVENIGNCAGKETVQVYVSKPQTELEKARLELVAFEKTMCLEPEENQVVSIVIPKSHLSSYYETSAAYVLEEGKYVLWVGNCIKNLKFSMTHIQEKYQVIKQVKNRMVPDSNIEQMRVGNMCFPSGEHSGIVEKQIGTKHRKEIYPCMDFSKGMEQMNHTISFEELKNNHGLLEAFVTQMNLETLARIAICAKDGWGMDGIGEAGKLYQPDAYNLPQFMVADGNSGVNLRIKNIGMPSGATICASFNRELSEKIGQVIGEEAKELGIDLILAPALNIHRNPLNGRQPEYFSEDPLLAGIMAGYYCRGLEGTGIGGCYKHLLANNAETSRKRNQSIISERAIREIYFRAFEYALEIHQPVSVMTAYNAVNGVFTSEDADLIQGLLRAECEFEGFVMTDWESYSSADIIEMQIAGNTWITPGSEDDTFTKPIVEAVENGRLQENRLRENVYYFMKALLKLQKTK